MYINIIKIPKALSFALLFFIGQCSVLAQELFVESPLEVAAGYGFHHPQIEISNDGMPLVIWTDQAAEAAYIARHNGVDGFNTPFMLNPPGLAVQSYSWSGPDLSVDDNNVYVIFRSANYEAGHIYLVKSTNNGISFGDTVRVDHLEEGFGQYPDIAVYQDTLFVAFMDHNEAGLDPQYVFTRSVDGGATFETVVTAGELLGGEACDCCPPEILVDEDKVIIYFRRNNDDTREIKAVVSYDRGASFSDWFSVDDHEWILRSCPSTGPDARFLDDETSIAAYKTEYDGENQIFFSAYNLETAENEIQEISAEGYMNTNNNYPQLAVDGDQIGIVWESVQTGTGTDVLFNYTSAEELNFNPENAMDITETIGVQAKPDIAISDGLYHVVYANSHTMAVEYLRIGPSLGLQENDMANPLSIYHDITKMSLKVNIDDVSSNQVSIRNLNGKLISTFTSVKGEPVEYNTSDLASGIYIVSIVINNKIYSERFVR